LRRQAGALDVKLDGNEGYAFLTLTPAQIDFPALVRDVYGAGYTTTSIRLESSGKIVRTDAGLAVELTPTGQQIALAGEAAEGELGDFTGMIQEWSSEQPQLELGAPAEEVAPTALPD